jgi:hypothetical protein
MSRFAVLLRRIIAKQDHRRELSFTIINMWPRRRSSNKKKLLLASHIKKFFDFFISSQKYFSNLFSLCHHSYDYHSKNVK